MLVDILNKRYPERTEAVGDGPGNCVVPGKGTILECSAYAKRYFMGWQLASLQALYSMDDLLSLQAKSINLLDITVRKDTVRLFFGRRNPFVCSVTKGAKPRGLRWRLPELRLKHVGIIKDTYETSMRPLDYLQVAIYNYMLNRAKEGRHTMSSFSSMLEDICGSDVELRKNFCPAMEVLEKMYCDVVVEDEGDNVYLRDHYAADSYICEALKTLFERDKAASRKDEIVSLYGSVCKGKASKIGPMCDEQMGAMKMHVACPMMYVGGTGGSGKTRFLEHVSDLYSNKKRVYGTSFMAAVVDVLHERLKCATVATCHSLMYDHMNKCPKLNPKMKEAGVRCPLEGFEVLLVDEFSTVYTLLFCVLLYTFMECANLKRVVVTGDHRQLPSISEGNILKDFVKGMPWSFMDFRHNHRVKDPAFALIRHNADAIAEGRYCDMKFDSDVVTLVSPQENRKEAYQECLHQKLAERKPGHYEFHVVSRTNEMKSNMISVLESHYLGRTTMWSSIYVDSKFIIRKNDKDLGIINNRILVLTDVWDEMKRPDVQLALSGTEDSVRIPPRHNGRNWDAGGIWRDSTESPVQRGYARFIAFVPLERIKEKRSVLQLTKKLNRRLVKAEATTTHCFQGREIDHFAFVSKVFPCSFDTREALYTASTRPRKSMLYISSKEAIRRMCENPEPPRDTGLARMLEGSLSLYKEGVFSAIKFF
jgi:hypothetical protein